MKKNILKLVFTSAFALVAGYSIYASQKKVEMSDLAIANVEALASGEVIVGPWYCAGSGYCYDSYTHMLFEGTKYNF